MSNADIELPPLRGVDDLTVGDELIAELMYLGSNGDIPARLEDCLGLTEDAALRLCSQLAPAIISPLRTVDPECPA